MIIDRLRIDGDAVLTVGLFSVFKYDLQFLTNIQIFQSGTIVNLFRRTRPEPVALHDLYGPIRVDWTQTRGLNSTFSVHFSVDCAPLNLTGMQIVRAPEPAQVENTTVTSAETSFGRVWPLTTNVDISNAFRFGARFSVACLDRTHRLTGGASTVMCRSGGHWSETLAQCVGKHTHSPANLYCFSPPMCHTVAVDEWTDRVYEWSFTRLTSHIYMLLRLRISDVDIGKGDV
jgi:hypothetical protein